MSIEAVGVLIAFASLMVAALGAILGVMVFALRRMDRRFDRVDARFDKMDSEMGGMRGDIVQLQIAVARLEGPNRGLALR